MYFFDLKLLVLVRFYSGKEDRVMKLNVPLTWLQGGTFHMRAFFWRMVKQVKLHFAKYWHVSSNRVDRLQNPMYVVTLDVAHSNETIFKFCYGKIYKWSVY